MRRIGLVVLAIPLLWCGCGRAPETLHVTVSRQFRDALTPLMRKHQLGLFVLKSTPTPPGADRLAGHPLLVLCPPSACSTTFEHALDIDVAHAVRKGGPPVFSGVESYLVLTNASCASDGPCMTSTVRASGEEPPLEISQNMFGKTSSVKDVVAYCLRRMRENQGVLLARRESVTSVSSDLLELVLD